MSIEQQPWMVALAVGSSRSPDLICSGSLIGPRTVLTAAHCFNDVPLSRARKRLRVVTGRTGLRDREGRYLTVTRIRVHPDFSRRTGFHDLAVVTLSRAAVGSPIELVPDRSLPRAGSEVSISGWGRTSNSATRTSNGLRSGVIALRSSQTCKRGIMSFDSTFQICASRRNGDEADTCRGDSGGPVVVERAGRPVVVAVTSFGYERCGKKYGLSYYARVAPDLAWIRQRISGR